METLKFNSLFFENVTYNKLYPVCFQIHSVEDFVCSVNAHLTTRQENERLKGIMARIEAYDVVVSVHLNNNNLVCVIDVNTCTCHI